MEIYDRMQERADWVFNYRIIACEQHDERTLHIIISFSGSRPDPRPGCV